VASELGLSIKIGAVVGGAVAALGTVQGQLRRMSEAALDLTNRQDALNREIKEFVGPRTPAQLAAINAQYEKLGKTLENLKDRHAQLSRAAQRREDLRTERAAMRSDALDTLAVGAAVAAPVKLAIDFESAMADVKKVVDFERPEGFKRLGDDILALTRTLPLTATELAKITASGGQLGVAEKDLLGFTQTVAKMATAFDMAAEDAGDSMAKLANVYQIPILQIGRLGDAINELSNKSPAKASDIVRTLGRVGGVAKQFGLTELQASSLANAFIALGKPPEVAGTAINGMLTKLATADKQGKKFQAALADMGLSANGLKKAIGEDAQGALVGFLKKLESVPEQQRMGVLVDLFGLEYADDVAVLAGSVKTYTDSIDVLNGKGFNGSMDKEFAARAATTGNNLKLLKNGMTELGIHVGSAVLPALNELVNSIKPVVIDLATWAKANPEVVNGVMKVAAGFAAMKLATLGLGYALNLVMSSWASVALVWAKGAAALAWLRSAWLLNGASILGRLSGAVATVGRVAMTAWPLVLAFGKGLAMTIGGPLMLAAKALLWIGRALLLNPIGLAVTVIAGGAYLIYRNWSPISAWFTQVWGKVKAAFSGAWEWFKGLPATFAKLGSDLISGLVGGITAKLSAARDTIVGFGQNIKGWFAQTLGIKSPSRVFMGFGNNIGEGAELGMLGKLSAVKGAAKQLAGVAAASALLAGNPAVASSAGGTALSKGAGHGGAGGDVHISFAPTIQLRGGGDVRGQVNEAMQVSMRDLEQMLRRLQAEQQRRAF